MKKWKILFLLLFSCLLFAGCGKQEVTPPKDLQAVYENMMAIEGMPEMILVPADKAELLYGIPEGNCRQELTAICSDSLNADEIWLIEAKDASAAAEIESLAKKRQEQKASELKDYLPEQYSIVQQGKIIRKGTLVALLISPKVTDLSALLES